MNRETALWSRGIIEFAGKTVSSRLPCTQSRSSKAMTNNGHRIVKIPTKITEHRAKRIWPLTLVEWVHLFLVHLMLLCQLHELFTALSERNDREQWVVKATEEAAADDFKSRLILRICLQGLRADENTNNFNPDIPMSRPSFKTSSSLLQGDITKRYTVTFRGVRNHCLRL